MDTAARLTSYGLVHFWQEKLGLAPSAGRDVSITDEFQPSFDGITKIVLMSYALLIHRGLWTYDIRPTTAINPGAR